ncbi:MAG: RNA polymerase II mediator complex subunit [Alyxoria varia]|nr:MAG: RNA polymerase II mediator complex subunit [Alyxoria varia]
MASETRTATSFPLSLRPQAVKDEEADSIPVFVRRLNEERGHLRNITEDSLREELKTAEEGDTEDAEYGQEDVEALDPEAQRKRVYEAKAEMIQFVAHAMNEVMTLQDFVSFLLKKDGPPQAQRTISPALQQMLPVGLLDFDMWPQKKKTEAQEAHDKMVATGWNLKTLDGAADRLLDRASSLEKQIDKENKYWDEILSVREKGWPVRRHPKDIHAVGVNFGFVEAGPLFASRGFAPLRANDDGSIVLDQSLEMKPKSVRVRIKNNVGDIVQASNVPQQVSTSQGSLEALIHQARDSIFDEELFHEIQKEARTLTRYNVKLVDNNVIIPTSSSATTSSTPSAADALKDSRVLIDLVPLDEPSDMLSDQQNSQEAELITLSLRLLLSNLHKRRFRQRSDDYPKISSKPQVKASSDMLRPLVEHLHHYSTVRELDALFTGLQQALGSAGFTGAKFTKSVPSIRRMREKAQEAKTSSSYPSAITTAMETVVASLTKPRKTSLTLTIPPPPPTSHPSGTTASSTSSHTTQHPITLTIKIHTTLTPPTHGQTYTSTTLGPLPAPTNTHLRPRHQQRPVNTPVTPARLFRAYREPQKLRAHVLDTVRRVLVARVLARDVAFRVERGGLRLVKPVEVPPRAGEDAEKAEEVRECRALGVVVEVGEGGWPAIRLKGATLGWDAETERPIKERGQIARVIGEWSGDGDSGVVVGEKRFEDVVDEFAGEKSS